MTENKFMQAIHTPLSPWKFRAAVIAIVLTTFDGIFTYGLVNAGLGREANPILNTFVSYYEDQGMSHMDAFGTVMLWRIMIGILMILLLAIGTTWPQRKQTWLVRNGLPFVAWALIALTLYNVTGYFLVFQYR